MNQADVKTVIECAINDHRGECGPLLPILHQIQRELRHIPDTGVGIIARALNLSRAEVHGVISYYHTFTSKPLGSCVVEVCRAESCQAMGSRRLEEHIKNCLGIDYGETTTDGVVGLEPVYCLGNCACSPSLRVAGTIYGRVSVEKVDTLLSTLRHPST